MRRPCLEGLRHFSQVHLCCGAIISIGIVCLAVISPLPRPLSASPGLIASAERENRSVLAAHDLIILGDVANNTNDAIFEGTLRQALRTALDESPWLNILSDVSFASIRKKTEQPPAAALRDEVVRAVCRQTHGVAFVSGSIDRYRTGFVISLKLADCLSGQTLAEEQRMASRKAKIVDVLGGAVRRLREKIGEPHDSVQRFSTPLSQATTSSFAALKTWSLGLKALREKGAVAAVPLLSTAVKLDPGFATATYDLGIAYRNAGEEGRARDLFTAAFALRQRASTRKRFAIAAQYHSFVTVDYEKAVESFTEWIQSYPNDEKAVNNFGSLYGDVCRYEQAIAKFMEARRMDPGDVIPQENLVELLPAIGKFDEGRATYEQMLRNGLDDDTPHVNMFSIAFHQNDEKEMARQIAWFDEKPNLRHEILSEEADAAAYGGHLARAHELTQQAVQSALAVGNKEQAAVWLLNAAWREQLFGNLQRAHDDALRALKIAPNSREGEAVAPILLARMGDFAKSKALMNDLEKRYSNHSVVQSYWLPSIRAQIALQKNDTAAALNELQTAAPLDTLYPQVMFYSHMPSVVLRAEAYSRSGQFALAAVEWSKVLDNPGIVQLSATAPMARLQLARSYVSQAALGDSSARAKARAAYKEFLALWQDADVGIHVLTEARSEYSKLQ